MSLLHNCDECNMTCCPNYNPYRLPKDIGKIRAREAMEKVRRECKNE